MNTTLTQYTISPPQQSQHAIDIVFLYNENQHFVPVREYREMGVEGEVRKERRKDGGVHVNTIKGHPVIRLIVISQNHFFYSELKIDVSNTML